MVLISHTDLGPVIFMPQEAPRSVITLIHKRSALQLTQRLRCGVPGTEAQPEAMGRGDTEVTKQILCRGVLAQLLKAHARVPNRSAAVKVRLIVRTIGALGVAVR